MEPLLALLMMMLLFSVRDLRAKYCLLERLNAGLLLVGSWLNWLKCSLEQGVIGGHVCEADGPPI